MTTTISGSRYSKNKPSKICGRQPLENLKWYDDPSTSWPSFMARWFTIEMIHSKMYSNLCSHNDVTNFEVHRMALNKKKFEISRRKHDFPMKQKNS